MVVCICSCELFDPAHKGKYRGGQVYPDDTLAEVYPAFFSPEAASEPVIKKTKKGGES